MRSFLRRRRTPEATSPAPTAEASPAPPTVEALVDALIMRGRVLAESARIIVSGQVSTGTRSAGRYVTTEADPRTAANTLAHALDDWDMADAELTATVNHVMALRRGTQA